MQEGGYQINLAVASSSKKPFTAKVRVIAGNELRCYTIEVCHDKEAVGRNRIRVLEFERSLSLSRANRWHGRRGGNAIGNFRTV
jgi:hypothetical protein